MLEPSANRILAQALQAGLLGWALSLAVITRAGAAEPLPASVRACTAETDRERRLNCFDREVARFPDSQATSQAARNQPTAPSSAPPPSATPPRSTAPAAEAAAKVPAANAASANVSSGTSDAAAPRKADNAKPSRIAARLVSIDRSPNEMVLHLDNGQVWEELQGVAGDLSLKVGDNITIDRRLGSYWLTGPHVSGMKVRQKS